MRQRTDTKQCRCTACSVGSLGWPSFREKITKTTFPTGSSLCKSNVTCKTYVLFYRLKAVHCLKKTLYALWDPIRGSQPWLVSLFAIGFHHTMTLQTGPSTTLVHWTLWVVSSHRLLREVAWGHELGTEQSTSRHYFKVQLNACLLENENTY